MVAIVHTSSAHMPSSCKGHYRKVYVLDVPYWLANAHALGHWSPVARTSSTVHRIIRDFGPQSVGKTPRAAYQRTVAEAEALVQRINSAGDMATAEQIIGAGGSA